MICIYQSFICSTDYSINKSVNRVKCWYVSINLSFIHSIIQSFILIICTGNCRWFWVAAEQSAVHLLCGLTQEREQVKGIEKFHRIPTYSISKWIVQCLGYCETFHLHNGLIFATAISLCFRTPFVFGHPLFSIEIIIF